MKGTSVKDIRDRKKLIFDEEDERGANRMAQIAILVSSVLFNVVLLLMIVMDLTRITMQEYLVMLLVYVFVFLICIIFQPVVKRNCPWNYRHFLMTALFIVSIAIQATTQSVEALFLAFPILLACRYHDRRFLKAVVFASFVAVILKELLCWKLGTFDLNTISVLDNIMIENGKHFQQEVLNYVDNNLYVRDIILFSILPQWGELAIISVAATLLADNGRELRESQREAIRREAAVDNEMKSAKEIQMGLLPNKFDIGEGFDLFASSLPAKNVGGDFYDCFMIDEKHLAIVVADVSGKGMSAALFMATTKMCIHDYIAMGLEVEEVFTRVNRSISQGNKMSLFVTAWMGILDLTTGTLDFVNAGHNPPLIRKESGYEYLEMKKNIVLGIFDSYQYEGESLQLGPGESIVLYTDGVTESRNDVGELYEEERLKVLLNGLSDTSSCNVVSQINDTVKEFAGEQEQYDDVTVLALKYEGLGERLERRTFPAQSEQFEAVKSFVESTLQEFGIARKEANRMLITMDELFTNVVKYAYHYEDGDVEIRLAKNDGKVAITFIDEGIPFDPLKEKSKPLFTDTGELRIGGRGISMVKSLMDDVQYSYIENRNIVTATLMLE